MDDILDTTTQQTENYHFYRKYIPANISPERDNEVVCSKLAVAH